ncbi:mechanosensitive ion channel protein MscS [Arthrobacter pityocampae]|uniref:Mechanosensitive ion channel protein MscS n=1 Tax=Arthrobacter pityocampae TaxID=547334 RepID=A0A2S5J0Y0_9MICC|nr:mechanosensitive ion channel domain-containing protein [Arthrobacter pityocampae]PPB50478.1 mechanosensitive ion channel protein MscS [Arthrobacter pityocampae]
MTFLNSLGYGGQVLAALVTVIGAVILWLVIRYLINRSVKRVQSGYSVFKKPHFRWAQPALRPFDSARRVQRAETIGGLLSSVAALTIAIIAGLMVIDTLGFNIGPILASVGIVGIAIGFGAREVIRDAFLGFFITMEDQYGIGDTIEVGDTVGVVQSLGLRITRLVDEDGAIWYVRNGDITKVGNRSQGEYVAPAPEPTVPAAPALAQEQS